MIRIIVQAVLRHYFGIALRGAWGQQVKNDGTDMMLKRNMQVTVIVTDFLGG